MKFFQPTKKFLNWIAKLAGTRPVIDCGCGEGHVTEALLARGVNALGIDRLADGSGIAVPCDATTFQFPDRAIVLFCRPCHNSWVEETIKQAKRRADVILYIGLERNVEDDLGQFEYDFKKIGKNAGKDGEYVWAMRKIASDVVRWCLLQPDYWSAPSWMEDGGNRWINLAGGYMPKTSKDRVLESVLTDDWRQLDWTKTGLYRTSGDAGWLDPSGKMHYCDSQDHREYADLILHSCDEDLLEDGWTRVYAKGTSVDFHCRLNLTAEQRNFLQQNGYRGVEEDETDSPMLSAGDGKEYPTEPTLLKRDRTSE